MNLGASVWHSIRVSMLYGGIQQLYDLSIKISVKKVVSDYFPLI